MASKIQWILVACLCIVSLILPSCAPATTAPPSAEKPGEKAGVPIKIAVIGPMEQTVGMHMWGGAKFAADEINEAGGVQVGTVKRPITLIKAESNEMASIPDAVLATERAITVDKADLFLGAYRSEASLAEQDLFAEYKKVAMLGGASPATWSRLKTNYDKYKYCFNYDVVSTQSLPIMKSWLQSMLGIVGRELGVKQVRVAILVDKSNAGESYSDVVKAFVPDLGGTIVGTWFTSPTTTDMSAELTAIKAADAHLIFFLFVGPSAAVFQKQWTDLQIPTALMGIAPEAMGKGFWDASSGKANYMSIAGGGVRAALTDKTIPFIDNYEKISGQMAGQYSMWCYGAIKVFADAINRAGTVDDADKIITAIEATDLVLPEGRLMYYGKDMKAPAGAVSVYPELAFPHCKVFGPGYLVTPAIQWQDGKIEVVYPVNWEGYSVQGAKSYQVAPWVKEYWKDKAK